MDCATQLGLIEAMTDKCLFVVDVVDTVVGDTSSECVTAATTTNAADVSVGSDAGVSSVSSSLVYTAVVVTTSPSVSAGVPDTSATVTSTAVTDTVALMTTSSAGGMVNDTVTAVPPATMVISAAAPLLTAAALAAATATGSPYNEASSISSPEQSAADVLDEHAADAAMTIPLVRTPGAAGTTVHLKPSVPVVQSDADASLTAVVPADSVGHVSVVAAESDGDERLAGSEAGAEPASTSATVNAAVTTIVSDVTSAGLTVNNGASTEPLSDEVCVFLV